jgi:hypothetical protein
MFLMASSRGSGWSHVRTKCEHRLAPLLLATTTTLNCSNCAASDAVSLIAAVATVVAAIAALAAIYFARETVREAVRARRESASAHDTQMLQSRSAHGAQMLQMSNAMTLDSARHRQEMTERTRAFAAEMVLRRIEQAERVSELFLQLVEVAREEYFSPPAPLHETGSVMTTTRIPAILARVKIAVAILADLGGPDVSDSIPVGGRGEKAGSMRVWTGGIAALVAMESLAKTDDRLTLKSIPERRGPPAGPAP